jgi:hypothetical protein
LITESGNGSSVSSRDEALADAGQRLRPKRNHNLLGSSKGYLSQVDTHLPQNIATDESRRTATKEGLKRLNEGKFGSSYKRPPID